MSERDLTPGINPRGGASLPPELLEVESVLAHVATRPPRSEFRTVLRARFVDGDFSSPADVVLARWKVPGPRADFRASLRDRFLAGARTADQGPVEAEPVPSSAPEQREPVARVRRARRPTRRTARTPRPWYRSPVFQGMGVIAAAAAVLLMVLPQLGQAARIRWHLLPGPGEGSVNASALSIDGEPARDLAAKQFDAAISGPECKLETGGRLVRFARDRELMLQVNADSRVRLSPLDLPAGKGLRIRLEGGGVAVTLESGFSERIEVETPFGVVRVEGRGVGVELKDGGLCICCLEGSASLKTAAGNEYPVRKGTTLFVDPQREIVEVDFVVHPEPLREMIEAAGEHLGD